MKKIVIKHSSKMILGLILIFVGLLLILDNFSVIYFGEIIDEFWPVLIILFGVFILTKKSPAIILGTSSILFGIFLQLRELNVINFTNSRIIFSIFVIFLGLIIVAYSIYMKKGNNIENKNQYNNIVPPEK